MTDVSKPILGVNMGTLGFLTEVQKKRLSDTGDVDFAYSSSFGRFRASHYLELSLWRLLRSLSLTYPENCLLAVYERLGAAGTGP